MKNAEQSLLQYVGHFIRSTGYTPNQEEQACITAYDRSPILYVPVNTVVWGYIAWRTLDFTGTRFNAPRWISMFGVVGISAGAFATVWFSSKLAARDCLQCLINTRDKKTELYKTVRKVLGEHHPNAHKFFAKEKWRLEAATAAAQEVEKASTESSKMTTTPQS
ncbi:hypothetical protein HK102_000962 [Quaeritorhiza haematococci]|nr:hypothetical protein HK102_000962 [Quaeritorhiza haematococci]